MEVPYKGSNAWEVLVIERDRDWIFICLDQWMILGAERRPPKLGDGGFTTTFEDGSVVWAIDCYGCFVKHKAAFGVS